MRKYTAILLALVAVFTLGAILPNDFSVDERRYIIDPQMNARAHVSHFGALKTSSAIPVVKANFPGSSLNTEIWDEIAVSGGSTTVEDGVGKIKTGTNSAGSVKLISVQSGRFEAGQVSVYQSGVYAGAPVADNIRRWGLMDATEQNGLFFELDGTTFNVVARHSGTDTEVAQASFNGDRSFTPGASNNTYRIHYSAGRAYFQRANAGRVITLHTMVDSDLPLVEDLDLGLYYENTNSGNTSDIELRVRGASSSVFGDLRRFNTGGALVTADFGSEVSRRKVAGYEVSTKFGRNPDIDTGTAEDLWSGGNTYTGFNATANENIEILSSSTNDVGSETSSGTATGGSRTTLVDSGADFVSDSVSVGDILVNDTRGIHGRVSAVAATTLTVDRLVGSSPLPVRNASGDSYRVVSTSGTGAALVKLMQLLDEDYEQQVDKYVIPNGTTVVAVTGNFIRCSRARIILAGSAAGNAGTITIRQATTEANVFAVLPAGNNQTTIGCFTVPMGKTMLLKRLRIGMVRANGSAGSATVSLRVRRQGEVFRGVRVFEIQNGAGIDFTQIGGDSFRSGTDVKIRIESVSDNNSVFDGAFEYFLLDD